jgi:hypothetical protein
MYEGMFTPRKNLAGDATSRRVLEAHFTRTLGSDAAGKRQDPRVMIQKPINDGGQEYVKKLYF